MRKYHYEFIIISVSETIFLKIRSQLIDRYFYERFIRSSFIQIQIYIQYIGFITRMLKFFIRPCSNLFVISRNQFGILKFNLPDLGEKIKEGTIKKLYVKEGDNVSEFQKLADVASDKQFTQITASDAGIIKKIYYKQQDVCQVGELFLQIQVGSSPEPTSTVKQDRAQLKSQPNTNVRGGQKKRQESQQNNSGTILATPYVRGIIKQKNLDITKIKGSGANGRILQADINAYLSQKKVKQAQKKQSRPTQSPKYQKISKTSQKVVKMNNFEKGMQKSMTESNKIPHLYLHEEFDITQTEKMRKTIKSNDKKVTLMGILIKTFSLALKKYPIINSTYEPDKNQFQYTTHDSHNISIAIDSPNGLVVPNIKNVQQCNLLTIQKQLERLRTLATQAKLTSKQLGQGTVCLSNIGTIAGIMACPLILPPQVCIVAISKMQTVPKYVKQQVVPRTVITVSYGCDHRVIDGGTIARFSNEWKKVLQNPYLALAEMS